MLKSVGGHWPHLSFDFDSSIMGIEANGKQNGCSS